MGRIVFQGPQGKLESVVLQQKTITTSLIISSFIYKENI